ncbi:major capsid protein P2 [Pseudoalteromonas xiamenensis]
MREYSMLPTITGVAKGAKGVALNLPVGVTYDKIHLVYSGVTPAQIENISIELGGRLISTYSSLQDVINENKRYKRPSQAGITTLHFVRDDIESAKQAKLVEQRFFALGTSGIRKAQIKFDISGAAENPSIEAFCEKPAVPSGPGFLFKRRSYTYALNNGITEISDLPRPPNTYIGGILIKAKGVSSCSFEVDNVKWREAIPRNLHDLIHDQNKRAVIEDELYLDFMPDGDMYESLKLDTAIQDMRLKVQCDQQTSAEVCVYYFDNYAISSF